MRYLGSSLFRSGDENRTSVELTLLLALQDSLDLEAELCQYFSQSEPGHSPLSDLMLMSSKADGALHPGENLAQQNGIILSILQCLPGKH